MGQDHVFDQSEELLSRLCGVTLSGKQIENLCHHYGEVLEEEPLCQEPAVVKIDDRRHYAMVDGSYIMTREQKWCETKTGRLFREQDNFNVSDTRSVIKASRYASHIGSCAAFKAKMDVILQGHSRLVFVADGAT